MSWAMNHLQTFLVVKFLFSFKTSCHFYCICLNILDVSVLSPLVFTESLLQGRCCAGNSRWTDRPALLHPRNLFFFFFSLLRMNGFQSLQDREYSGRSVLLKLLLILKKKKKLEYDCFTMLC